MPLKKLVLLVILSLIVTTPMTFAQLRIVTSTEDLASLSREIGGDFVEVDSIAKGYQDPHFVEAKPSYLLKLKKADLFIQVGLELEVAWVPPLLINARNQKILPGNTGFMEASEGCEILQKPKGPVDRSLGDVHPLGNPHYWLDPANGLVIAGNISRRLSLLDPQHSDAYQKNLADFAQRLAEKEKEWEKVSALIKGTKVITYHNSWANFSRRFGLEVVNFVEPKPGIPPSPAHIQSLIAQIRAEKIPLLLIEPYFDPKLCQKIAQQTQSRLIVFPPSVGAVKGIDTYFDLFDYNLRLLYQSLREGGKLQ